MYQQEKKRVGFPTLLESQIWFKKPKPNIIQQELTLSSNQKQLIVPSYDEMIKKPPPENPTRITLNISEYQKWNEKQVASVLSADESDGGRGLSFERLEPFVRYEFDGSCLKNVVQHLQEQDETYTINNLESIYNQESIPQISSTCTSIVYWVRDNLLKPISLNSAICRYNNVRLLDKHVNTKHEITVENILETYSARVEKQLIVTNEALYMPYLVDETLLETVSQAFQQVLQAGDKQSVRIPFMTCAPGSGKSRTLQEIFPKTKQGIQFKDNSLEILISFGNGTPLKDETDYEKALCGRVLYSYLDTSLPYRDFLKEIWSCVKGCDFQKLLVLIASHWRTTHSKSFDDELYIYLGIDEFTNLAQFSTFNNENNHTITFLDGVINIIGDSILSLKNHVRILPFFAGLDYQIFTSSIADSIFNCKYITPYKYTEIDEQNIVKKYFPSLYYSKELWKVLLFCNRQPRLLAWLIDEYQLTNNLQQAYTNVQSQYTSTYHTGDISLEVAKWILASVITQEPTSILSKLTDSNWSVKKLEEKGWISFQPRESGRVTIFAPFPLLNVCANCLKDPTESKLFNDFLKLLEDSTNKSKTYDKEFEKFNAIDIVLNKCFLYLGKVTMGIEERFRGVKFGKTQTGIINLESCSNNYTLKEVEFTTKEPQETIATILENKYMIVNSLEQCFFDRFMRAEVDFKKCTIFWQDIGTESDACHFQKQNLKTIEGKHFTKQKLSVIGAEVDFKKCTIFWQDIGTESDACHFQKQNLKTIEGKHFTKQKLSVIGAKTKRSLLIVVTTKSNSSSLPNNFGIIDATGLKQYYGEYVYRLFYLHLPIPFPINEYYKYSAYDLAIFLGITTKRAQTIIDRVRCNNESISLEDLKEFNFDHNMITFDTSH